MPFVIQLPFTGNPFHSSSKKVIFSLLYHYIIISLSLIRIPYKSMGTINRCMDNSSMTTALRKSVSASSNHFLLIAACRRMLFLIQSIIVKWPILCKSYVCKATTAVVTSDCKTYVIAIRQWSITLFILLPLYSCFNYLFKFKKYIISCFSLLQLLLDPQ